MSGDTVLDNELLSSNHLMEESITPMQSSNQDLAENLANNGAVSENQLREESRQESGRTSPRSPAVREIHKNSWLKKMPCISKRTGKFSKIPKPEKFWVVFCVHDDKEAFLEFYENRRSAYSHKSLQSVSLSHILHISPTIVVQENDHEFAITLDTEVIRLAASTREQMIEWMDTMRTKLRDMGILQPKDNVYSKEPVTTASGSPGTSQDRPFPTFGSEDTITDRIGQRSDVNRHSSRDPNSPLPAPPPILGPSLTNVLSENHPTTVMYVRNPPLISPAPVSIQSPINTPLQSGQETQQHQSFSPDVFTFDIVANPVEDNGSATAREQLNLTFLNEPSSSSHSAFSVPTTPVTEESSVYEPLFCSSSSSSQELTLRGIRNPSYENPCSQRRSESDNISSGLSRASNDQRRMSSSSVSDMQRTELKTLPSGGVLSKGRLQRLGNAASTSEPSLTTASCSIAVDSVIESSVRTPATVVSDPISLSPVQNNSLVSQPLRIHIMRENSSTRSVAMPLEEGSSNSITSSLTSRQNLQILPSNDTSLPTDESGRPLSLKEAQVLKLQKEISHKSGVRLMLRKKDCISAVGLVESFGYVWIAGWKQKEHPLLHNTFHIGDRIVTIAGQRIHNVQDAQKAIKQQPLIVEFIVRRVPYGRVFAIKREFDGQSLGIVREGGTAEIKEVKAEGLAAKHGMPIKAATIDGNSLCNWTLTEINNRPLNLFFKDNEIHDRLNAVGLDISLLVQPSDLVKTLKKQLKTLRGYKDFIVQ